MTPAESQAFSPPTSGPIGLGFELAFTAFVQAVQELVSSTASQDRVNSAYLEYAGFVQAALAGQDVQAQGAEAYARYIQALQEALAPPPERQRLLEAFERYAGAVRETFIATDPEKITPETMAAVAHRLLTAATTVAGIAHASGSSASPSFSSSLSSSPSFSSSPPFSSSTSY